jgi:uncharacterized membrane protein
VGHDGCLFVLVVGVVVLFIRSINIRRDLESHVEKLKREIAELRAAAASPLRESAAERVEAMKRPPFAPVPRVVETPPPPVVPPASPVPPPSPVPEGAEVEPPPITLTTSGLPMGSYPPYAPETPEEVVAPAPAPITLPPAPAYAAASPERVETSGPSLMDRWEKFKANVDWELFTGVKLFAGLGGLALFIGAGFFVKYSIDRNLIPPALRLAISAVIGLALIVGSSRINRERFTVLRHTLGAGGIGVLYSVVFAATLYYHYLSNPLGFGLLTVVSATAFVLAVFFRGIPISVLGALGAYLTPILVSTGQGSLIGLFVYLAVVNVGLFQVVRRLRSALLLFIATVGTLGTLFLAAFSGRIHPESIVVAGVFIANLALFSYLLDRVKDAADGTRLLSWSGYALYLSATIAALLLLDRDGIGPLLIAIFGMAGSVALAFRDRRWFNGVVPYGAIMFVVAFLWTWMRFDPRTLSWGFLGLLLYGAAGGLGPVLLIRRYGLDKVNLGWFRVFPVALGLMLLSVVLKEQDIAFWLWPVILLLQVMGIMVSLVFGGLLQAGLLVLFFLACGLTWLFRMPPELGSPVFFGFLLFAGTATALAMVYAFKKLSDWRAALTKDAPAAAEWTTRPMVTEWLSAFPASAVFILLAASFWLQRPLQPNPGMVTLACFLALCIFLSRRLAAPIMGMVVLLSSLVSQAAWAFRPDLSIDLHVTAFLWSAAFFAGAVVAPFLFFRSIERWSRLWMAWALFEVGQGFFAIWAADHIWPRETSGWLPLALAVVKLPAVAMLQSRLKDRPERNAVLAFHGGVLLFYISSVPVMLLDQGWIGLTLVIESMLLLWLNRRVVHEGLRWVASFMAPIGLLLLFFALPQMKHAGDMAILNAAVLAVAGAVAALSFAVPLSGFPGRSLKGADLQEYFRWLAVGSGFFLLNIAIADIFAETAELFRIAPGPDAVQAICYALVWLTYGALIWSRLKLSVVMRHAGLILLCMGTGFLLILPVLFPAFVPAMSPLLNLGLPAYFYALVVLALLVRLELKQQTSRDLYNLLLLLLLLTGFVAVKVQMSSIVQPGQPFRFFFHQSSSMAVGSAAGWLAYGLGLLYWPRGLDRPFRIAGVVLVLAGLAKALTFPFLHNAAFGAMTPLVNTPSLLYLTIVIVLTALTLNLPQQHWPFVSPTLRAFWGVLLAVVTFCVLNIEISSVFIERGRSFSLETYGNLAHQLAYSLSWLLYSIGLLVVGIKWKTSKVRWAALVLMVGTAFKIFFMDLWRLGQLYRVASFVGLAAVLILVSFLYQRFMTGKDEEEKQEG